MARRDNQIGIEFTGRQRELLGRFANDKFFSARRIDLSKRLGQVSQGLLHHLPVVGQHSKAFLGYELVHLYGLINANEDKRCSQRPGEPYGVVSGGFGVGRQVNRDYDLLNLTSFPLF